MNGGEWKIENENLISEIKEGKRIERQKKYCSSLKIKRKKWVSSEAKKLDDEKEDNKNDRIQCLAFSVISMKLILKKLLKTK